jgi:hypothetical protein
MESRRIPAYGRQAITDRILLHPYFIVPKLSAIKIGGQVFGNVN